MKKKWNFDPGTTYVFAHGDISDDAGYDLILSRIDDHILLFRFFKSSLTYDIEKLHIEHFIDQCESNNLVKIIR